MAVQKKLQATSRRIEKLLREDSLERIRVRGKRVLLIICFFLVVLLSWILVQAWMSLSTESVRLGNDIEQQLASSKVQKSLADKPSANYDSIKKDLLFGKVEAATPVVSNVSAVPTPKVSTVALTLIGVYVSDDPIDSYAIIENNKDKEQEVFERGQTIFDAAKLLKIFPDKVEIDRNGTIEVLALEEGGSGGSGTGSSSSSDGASEELIKVDETELTQQLENLPLLLTQARAVPYFKDGKAVGLRLFAIKRDSLYEKVGLKNGDILVDINGESLADITQAAKIFEKLKTDRELSLKLERSRQNKVLKYEIR
jgi:general secretion pathway protein C